ncbi:MAG: hypothetical protein EOP46_11485 [Sphingobacteriaceae bacterium]|nr:MAG: hypothetical protein EOP46_11485 [Sphingobacteriaceae bacterium]
MKQIRLLLLLLIYTADTCLAQQTPPYHDGNIVDILSEAVKNPFYKPGPNIDKQLARIEKKTQIQPDLAARLNLVKAAVKLNQGDTAAAIRYTGQATIYIEQVDNETLARIIMADIATMYLRAGHKPLGTKYLRLSALGSRDKVVYTDAWLLGLKARNEAYVLLNDAGQIQTAYNNAAPVAGRAGKQPLYKLNSAFAESFIATGKINKAFEVLDILASDTGFTPAQTQQLYSRLIIYSIKAGRYKHLGEYFSKLSRLPHTGERDITTESWLAFGMYYEHVKKPAIAIKYYKFLAANQRKHGSTPINIEGIIRLASLYTPAQKDLANYYFGLLKKEIRGGMLQSAIGRLYLQALAKQQSGKIILVDTVNQDTAYKVRLDAATKELEYQYQVIKQKQDNILLKQQQRLQALVHEKKQQQYLLYILLLLLLVVTIGAVSILLVWKRRQASKEHAAEKLKLEQQHRANLAQALTGAQEEERSQIAETLHSEVGAMLAVARLNLSVIEDDSEETSVQVSAEQVKLASDILARLTQTIRDMSHQLMPLGLKQMGLAAAIEEMAKDINRAGVVKIETIFIKVDTGALPDDMQVNIYRMVQELFQNMLKHAGATEALLQIVRHPDSMNIIFEDNGRGIKDTGNTNGAGLAMMRKRAEYYGGSLTIEQRDGGGTMFLIELRLQPVD